MSNRVLIVGGGGREHTLAWKIAGDSSRPELFCAPGNAGTAGLAVNLEIGAEDVDGLLEWAVAERPDLTVVGPEVPLCAGLVDRFEAEGLRVFGPSMAAARLEGSKAFAKEIMLSGGVPTAEFGCFTDAGEACAYIRERGAPIVVKADGLAAGKGVAVCETVEQAEAFAREVLDANKFGAAGAGLLVEECLVGEEASILALVDGENVVMLASSQDHKRAFDGDKGPNTGGMGAYSPAPVVTDAMWPVIREEVINRTLKALTERGIVYKGVLYAGLMITDAGLKVLEFNCRFGDPETEAVLVRWDGDMLPAINACVDGTLSDELVAWKSDSAVCVVMASGGYPGDYEKGRVITGLEQAERMPGVTLFHAGTKLSDGDVVTAGGRVLGVTALGADLSSAATAAYQAVDTIRFDGAFCRRDIACRALNG